MYVTPAIALVLAGGAAFFALGFPGSGGAELPPTRLNAILLRREEQPDLYSLPGAEDIHVAASLEPIIVLVHGRTQCHDDLVDGHLLLVPVPLCGMLTEAEFLCLVEQACLPLRWHQLAWRVESIADSVQQLLRRIRETMLDAALTRTVPAALPAMGLCLILSEGRPDASARVMDASFESDRLTAAKLGSRDWARAMLKSYVAMSLWSRFVRQMSHDLKEPAGQGPSYDLAAREFQGYITEARISEALSQLAENSDPGGLPMRLALLGYSGPEAWPELDFHPVEAAIGRLRDSGALERRLSAGERARFLLSPDLTTNRPTP